MITRFRKVSILMVGPMDIVEASMRTVHITSAWWWVAFATALVELSTQTQLSKKDTGTWVSFKIKVRSRIRYSDTET